MQNYIIFVKHTLILISISLCTKFKVLTLNFNSFKYVLCAINSIKT